MRRVTASEARRNWFRLLDEAAAGEVIAIERGGRRILLQRDVEAEESAQLPDYVDLIRAPDAETADRWTWRWNADDGDLEPSEVDED
jgi:antitoxin (DNA-binding transcriptional repressor) of toxin-antitoxin stability system